LTHSATPSSGKRRTLIAIAGAGVLLYMGAAVAVDADKLVAALYQLGWIGCGLILAASLVNYLLRFMRWELYVRRLGGDIAWTRHLLYYISGFAFTVSPGKAGEAVRSVYLRAHGVGYSASLATLFSERLLDLLVIVLLSSLIVLNHESIRALVIGVLAVVLIALALVSSPSLPAWLERVANCQHGTLGKLLHSLSQVSRSSATLLKLQPLLIGLALGLVAWGAEGLGLFWICRGVRIEIDVIPAIGIYAVAALAGSAAFFLPGGIGGMEVVMAALLHQAGAPITTSLIATLLCRLATLWFAVLIGVLTAWALEFRPLPAPTRLTP